MPLHTPSREPRAQIFEFVEEKLGLGLWLWDYRQSRMQWSRGVYKLLHIDYGSVEPSLDVIRGMIHPDDLLDMHNMREVIDRQFSISREFRIILPDKRLRWIQNYGEMSTSADGQSQMFGFLLDITARKEKELDLTFVRERTNALERNVAVCFWNASRDGRRISLPKWEEWTGQTPEHTQDFGWINCVHQDDYDRIKSAYQTSVTDGVPFVQDFRLRLRDGNYVEIASRATLVANRLHALPEWTGVMIWRRAPQPQRLSNAISGRQLRAARALLNWTAADLAKASNTSISSIRRIEDYDGITQTRDTTLDKIRHAIEAAGVDFVGSNEQDQVIRLRISSKV